MYTDVDLILMAAGTGSRMKLAVKKQWMLIGEKPMFVHTLLRFLAMGFDSCILVVHETERLATQEALATYGIDAARCRLAIGGEDRQASVLRGLALATRPLVAVHDAARPFFQEKDIANVITKARETGAATLASPVRDTLVVVDQDEALLETKSRDGVWQVQTPQVFTRAWLCEAHEVARQKGYRSTDDTYLLRQIGHQVYVVRGASLNVKITEPDDALFIALWEGKHEGRSGL